MLRPTDALPTYLRDYREMRHSHDHDLLGVFRAVRRLIGAPRAVYPGSYVHLTPSLVFPRVCYVDSVKGFGAAMQSRRPDRLARSAQGVRGAGRCGGDRDRL